MQIQHCSGHLVASRPASQSKLRHSLQARKGVPILSQIQARRKDVHHCSPDGPHTQAMKACVAVAAAAALMFGAPDAALAKGSKIAEFSASGLVFKDSVEITALDDPEINGLTVFVSDFKRSIVDKLAKDFFSEPSQASITCAITGPVSFRKGPDQLGGGEGQEMFSEGKGLNLFKNKTLRIRRVYDASRNTVVYVAYSTRLGTAADDGNVSSGRYRTSLCAVNLPASALAPPVSTAADN